MEIYLVGGAVRDRLLDYPIYDHDWVVVGATAEEMVAQGYRPVGKDFPVFLHPETKEEYALARTERKSGHGYKGFEFFTDPDVTLEQDLQRRDLTINAMAEDQQGQLIDPYGGQQDLEKRQLRHVSNAFSEDPLRVLRVARFAARFDHLGFSVAPETQTMMQTIAASGELQHLTQERVWNELERSLGERSPQVFFEVLNHANALPDLFPEIHQLLNSTGATKVLNLLMQATAYGSTSVTRFALLCSKLANQHQLESLLETLKAPTQCKDFCRLVFNQSANLLAITTRNAEEKLALYERLDLQRRPERLPQLIIACRVLSNTSETADFAIETELNNVIQAVGSIQPKDLVAQGYKGKALGNELRLRRIRAIQAAE